MCILLPKNPAHHPSVSVFESQVDMPYPVSYTHLMTAPKQEKWAYTHWHELKIHCHCGTIGAVFDFYAGTVKRAPAWWQKHSLEWC